MRYAKQKSTGKLLERQSGGNPDNPVHLETLVENAKNIGIAENDIEVGYEDDAVVQGWLSEQTEAEKTYADKRKAEYDQLNQFEMQFDDDRDSTTTWVDTINEIKGRHPK